MKLKKLMLRSEEQSKKLAKQPAYQFFIQCAKDNMIDVPIMDMIIDKTLFISNYQL